MLSVLHVEKLSNSETIYRIFCIERIEDLTDISRVLVLGNLKLLKCIDFWIPSREITYRAGVREPSELVGKRVHVRSVGGRLLGLEVQSDESRLFRDILPVLATRPVGVRVLDDYVSLAISDTLYVLAPCRDDKLDLKFMLGKDREFLVGASVKNYVKAIKKLRELSEKGLLGKKKVSIEADFVVPLRTLLQLLGERLREEKQKPHGCYSYSQNERGNLVH